MKNVFVLSIIIFVSCRSSNNYVLLAGHSYYQNGGEYNRMIMPTNCILYNTTVYPDVEKYKYNDDFIIIKQIPSRKYVLHYFGQDLYERYTFYYKNFIESNQSAFEKPILQKIKNRDSSIYNLFSLKGASTKNSYQDILLREMIADSIIKNDPFYRKVYSSKENYWIIINSIDSLIGPLNQEEFLIERKRWKIPQSLIFEN